jgi:hypothetical protein
LEGDTICHIQCEDDIAAITIPGGIAVEITGGLIDGNYPNWVQIVPGISAMTPAKELRLSPRFISRFRKAAKLLNIENSMHLCFSGDEGTVQIRFHRSPGFYGLLMPIRLELDDRKLSEHPDWLIKRLSVKSMVEKEAA